MSKRLNGIGITTNVLLVLLFLGCKQGPSANGSGIQSKIDDFLTVTLKGKIWEDDVVEIYFAETVQEPYNALNKVTSFVKGSDSIQVIVFRLPERTYPFKIRIDLGAKGFETPIEILEIKLSTGRNSIVFNSEEINKAFRKNKYLETKSGSAKFYRKKIDGVYDPYLLSNDFSEIVVDLFSE